jgi:Uma2 family endonuclease
LSCAKSIGWEIRRAGLLTLTRDDLEKGVEPDSSYYIQNEARVREQENINMVNDPPPDLVLEVEYSRSAIDKVRLYAAIAVPEFWRYNGSLLQVYTLAGEQYSEVETSPTFAPVSVKEIPRFIQEAKKNGEIATTRAFRAWVQEKISAGEREHPKCAKTLIALIP